MSEGDPYKSIFSALKHPIRRKILRLLGNRGANYSELLAGLGIEKGHLNYHLRALEPLIKRSEEGTYDLSDYGRTAIRTMGEIEGVDRTGETGFLKGLPIKSLILTGLILICLVGLVGQQMTIYGMRSDISGLLAEIEALRFDLSFYSQASKSFSDSGTLNPDYLSIREVEPQEEWIGVEFIENLTNCSIESEVFQGSSYLLEVLESDVTLRASVKLFGPASQGEESFIAAFDGNNLTESIYREDFYGNATVSWRLRRPGPYLLVVGSKASLSLTNVNYSSFFAGSTRFWDVVRILLSEREWEYRISYEYQYFPNETRMIPNETRIILVRAVPLVELIEIEPGSPIVSMIRPVRYELKVMMERDGLPVPFKARRASIPLSQGMYLQRPCPRGDP